MLAIVGSCIELTAKRSVDVQRWYGWVGGPELNINGNGEQLRGGLAGTYNYRGSLKDKNGSDKTLLGASVRINANL